MLLLLLLVLVLASHLVGIGDRLGGRCCCCCCCCCGLWCVEQVALEVAADVELVDAVGVEGGELATDAVARLRLEARARLVHVLDELVDSQVVDVVEHVEGGAEIGLGERQLVAEQHNLDGGEELTGGRLHLRLGGERRLGLFAAADGLEGGAEVRLVVDNHGLDGHDEQIAPEAVHDELVEERPLVGDEQVADAVLAEQRHAAYEARVALGRHVHVPGHGEERAELDHLVEEASV